MIEKFSDEELKQIMKELGVKESGIRAFTVISDEANELSEIQSKKANFLSNDFRGKLYESVRSITAITLNNVVKSKKGYWKCSHVISKEDEAEYKQMFQEILEIIKKHNREWNGSSLA